MQTDKKQVVIKANSLIEASYELDLICQRLILLAIIEARLTGNGITSDTLLYIHASNYADLFGIDKNTAYKVLEKAANDLYEKEFTVHNFSFADQDYADTTFRFRWLTAVGYTQRTGKVYIRFSPEIVPMITQLNARYTSYELRHVAQLDSKYALRLYELLIQWKNSEDIPDFEIQTLRKQLGVPDGSFSQFRDLRRNVIDLAVNKINAKTDMLVDYQSKRTGKNITSLSFNMQLKKDYEKNNRISDTEKKEELNTNNDIVSIENNGNYVELDAKKIEEQEENCGNLICINDKINTDIFYDLQDKANWRGINLSIVRNLLAIRKFKSAKKISQEQYDETLSNYLAHTIIVNYEPSLTDFLDYFETAHGTKKTKKTKQTEDEFNPRAIELFDYVDAELWDDFCVHRQQMKKQLTRLAVKRIFNDFENWHKEGLDVNTALNKSIINGWSGVFKPNQYDAYKMPTEVKHATSFRTFDENGNLINQSSAVGTQPSTGDYKSQMLGELAQYFGNV